MGQQESLAVSTIIPIEYSEHERLLRQDNLVLHAWTVQFSSARMSGHLFPARAQRASAAMDAVIWALQSESGSVFGSF